MTDRRVEHLPGAGWFAASLAVYVAAGVVLKSPVLNWIVGPLWLFVTLFLVPALWRALRRRATAR
ncbi:MAG: hypothetical protein GWN79_18760 [Actinobacteria bacterium]|nr:hypothetical protein [Actinomycetota bacterium]NIS34207.1 hypothetical protein [Actinomycetota bacterium]NIT97305.1 hypothetical protein [Actinomycetota bacterium]NIU20985.1 hypothetical protein [Actinomycetota bacterium]NIU68980.1 hypothetical protein [Actinomycetota bacterium]